MLMVVKLSNNSPTGQKGIMGKSVSTAKVRREFTVHYKWAHISGDIETLDLPEKDWVASANEVLTAAMVKSEGFKESDFRTNAQIIWGKVIK